LTEILEKLLEYLLVVETKKQQEGYGNLYHLFIDNVLFVILTFGKLIAIFCLKNAINLWAKSLDRLIILKGSTVL
jgi:hypothetical protein